MLFDIEGLEELTDHLRDPSLIADPLDRLLHRVGAAAERAAQAKAPSVIKVADEYPSGRPFAVVKTNQYAGVFALEKGRRKGRKAPRLDVLRGWAAGKGIGEDALYPIARAISRRGIRGRRFMRAGRRAARQELPAAIAEMVHEIERRWGR